MKKLSVKTQLIIFLSILAISIVIIDKNIVFLYSVCVSVIFAISADSLIVYLKTKRFKITDSSVISGLIIGFVISGGPAWWKFLFAAILAMGSKHFIHFKNKHLFNPAAFGILSAVVLLHASTWWLAADMWYIFIPAGIYFTAKIRKIEIALSYMAIFLILFGFEAFMGKTPLYDILKYQNYFFIFIMLIEPKTTPSFRKGKIIFGTAAAVLVFVFTRIGIRFDAELVALFILNLFVPYLNEAKTYGSPKGEHKFYG